MEHAKEIMLINHPPGRERLVHQLQEEVYNLQRLKKTKSVVVKSELGAIETAFPQATFPTGAVHEFVSHTMANAASTAGFIGALAGRLVQDQGTILWIGTHRKLFPPSLKHLGIDASRVIFIDLSHQKDVLWAVEEALKNQSLSLVVGEISEISFNESRRLQLAVEQSHVTGLLHRYKPRNENTLACIARWKISALASWLEADMPGVGFSRWKVELLKVRNGRPGAWNIEWSKTGFRYLSSQISTDAIKELKTA